MKQRSPRESLPVSKKWEYRAFQFAAIPDPEKHDKEMLRELWLQGYSFKDAAQYLIDCRRGANALL